MADQLNLPFLFALYILSSPVSIGEFKRIVWKDVIIGRGINDQSLSKMTCHFT